MSEHYYGIFSTRYTPNPSNWSTEPSVIRSESKGENQITTETDYWVVECFELNAEAARETIEHGILFGTKQDYYAWYAQNISTISPPDIDLMRRMV